MTTTTTTSVRRQAARVPPMAAFGFAAEPTRKAAKRPRKPRKPRKAAPERAGPAEAVEPPDFKPALEHAEALSSTPEPAEPSPDLGPLFAAPPPKLGKRADYVDGELLASALEFGGALSELVPETVARKVFELSDAPAWVWTDEFDWERVELASPAARLAMTKALRKHLEGALQ